MGGGREGVGDAEDLEQGGEVAGYVCAGGMFDLFIPLKRFRGCWKPIGGLREVMKGRRLTVFGLGTM